MRPVADILIRGFETYRKPMWKLIYAAVPYCLVACGVSAAADVDASEKQRILKALASHEHGRYEILHATQETRSGQHVTCGLYRKIGSNGPAHLFGWIDNRLVMKFGPDWNSATICLIKHYNAPLP